jgi:hypothetical protein
MTRMARVFPRGGAELSLKTRPARKTMIATPAALLGRTECVPKW